MKNIPQTLIERLPKTDLHCHLDGSLRIETLVELAKKNGVKLFSYDPQVLMEHMGYGQVRASLEEYLTGFAPLIAVMQTPEDIERIFFEVCEDAKAENVWHLELRYCPYLHTEKGLTPRDMLEACIRAAHKAERGLGLSVRHILCGLKHDPRANIVEIAKLASMFREEGVVGFDLAGPESGYSIRDHQEALRLAKINHLFITIHAGESSGPENIFEALHDGAAHRIGHGTSLIRDRELLNYVIDHRIGVESCPISNLHTGSVKSLEEHPIRSFLDNGVRVSINTDNRLCSDTNVTKELLTVMDRLDFTLDQVKKLLVNGFKSAFLPHSTKALMLKKFNDEWDKLVG